MAMLRNSSMQSVQSKYGYNVNEGAGPNKSMEIRYAKPKTPSYLTSLTCNIKDANIQIISDYNNSIIINSLFKEGKYTPGLDGIKNRYTHLQVN